MARALPAPVKAIQAALQRVRDAGERARLERSLAYVKRLYGVPTRRHEETGDFRPEHRPRSPSAVGRW